MSRILFIFDASQSMNGTWEKSKKIDIAREILIAMIDSLEQLDQIQLALRVYGHQSPVPPQDCSDSKLEVAFGPATASRIRQKLRYIEPRGTTPLAKSLEMSVKDFPPCDDCRNIVILITDGIEACDGDPCVVSRNLQAQGITLKPFIIGIGMDDNFKESFSCIGTYYNAPKEEQFKEILGVVISQALNSTTAQVNLLDANGKPTETNVNMTFYNKVSGKVMHNYIHTMNNRGNPDTIILDPLVTYRLTVQTIPPVSVDSFKINPGIHNVIAADAPQGFLTINTEGGIRNKDMLCLIRKAGSMNTLNYHTMYKTEKYLIGNYDIEIPVLPKINLYDVEVKQSTTTTIKVPQPGLITFIMSAPGFGSIFLRETGKDLKWVYNLNKDVRSEIVSLQPGTYTVVFRPGRR
ncbi:MAG: VWA domain-containing protein [Bacteroidales bacterium]|nr:VWA domain-containing protein [Bacteroidales bacterium]